MIRGVHTCMTTGKRGEINVTPMIDVLLVLIIIFMVIAPEKSSGLNAQIPQPGGKGGSGTIVVSVSEDRSVKINTQAVEWNDLAQRLGQIFAARPDSVLFIAGARKAEFADVARVIDTARGAGIAHVSLMPKSHAQSSE